MYFCLCWCVLCIIWCPQVAPTHLRARAAGQGAIIVWLPRSPRAYVLLLLRGGGVLSTLYWGDNAKNIMWRDRQRHGDGVRREENIIWWSCQYFHHIVVLPTWALNLIIERGEIMEMIKRGERIFSPLDLAMTHSGWLLWLYFWSNFDFSLISLYLRMYQNIDLYWSYL